jgi:signal transduction histidine kinase
MGWVELIKLKSNDRTKVIDLADEMNSDLIRLNKITNRFSKIGSKPSLKRTSVNKVVLNVIYYFERRLPQTGKDVEIIIGENQPAEVSLNAELFEWVIENLIKNALDAIGSKKGQIIIDIIKTANNIELEITDNGKGIDIKSRRDIFKPGYSTKRRGWGLGLSLSKRIIEDYHKGKIFVKSSVINEGTSFKIILNKFDQNKGK